MNHRSIVTLILALVLLPFLAAQEHIVFHNPASLPTEAWTFVGLPERDQPKQEAGWLSDGEQHWAWVRHEGGIYALARLDAGEKRKMNLLAGKERLAEPFAWHPVLAQDVLAAAPSWLLGTEPPASTKLDILSASPAVLEVRFLAHWPTSRVTVECWATVRSGSSTIEWASLAVYGTTANDGQAQVATFPALTMTCRSRPWPDFAVRNGQATTATQKDGQWNLQLVAEGSRWHRASRFVSRGIICPVPDRAREQGRPIGAIYAGWQGAWMALGAVPARTPDTERRIATTIAAYLNPRTGPYDQPRPRVQVPFAGQTGEQGDFGAASDIGVTAMEPIELHDGLWQIEGYAIRPTGNREPGGEPMDAAKHPLAMTYNQRPDLNLGEGDRIGWPRTNQIAYIPGDATTRWTTVDDQHRADNALCAVYLLTRDRLARALIHDAVQLDRTDVYVLRLQAQAPRGAGRVALARAQHMVCGFPEAEMALRAGLNAQLDKTFYSSVPQDMPMRITGGTEEAKRGWLNSAGQQVYGPQGWQESIICTGLAAGHKATGEQRYRIACERIATTVTEQFWLQREGRLLHCYAMAWGGGAAYTPAQWPATPGSSGESWNDLILISGACDYWTAVAARFAPMGARNRDAVLQVWGTPKTTEQARWHAVQAP